MKINLPLNAANKALQRAYDLAIDAGIEIGGQELTIVLGDEEVSFNFDEQAFPVLASRLDRVLTQLQNRRRNHLSDHDLLTRYGHAVIQEMVEARSPGYAWKANQFWIDPSGVCLDGWDEAILGPRPTQAEQLEACRSMHRAWLEAKLTAMSGNDGVHPSDTHRSLQDEANARCQTITTPRRRKIAEVLARKEAAKSASAANRAAKGAP